MPYQQQAIRKFPFPCSKQSHQEALAGAEVLLQTFLALQGQHRALEVEAGGLRDSLAAKDAELQARWNHMLALTAQATELEAKASKWMSKEEGRRGENLAWARRYEAEVGALQAKIRRQGAVFLGLHRRFEAAKAEGVVLLASVAEKEAELRHRYGTASFAKAPIFDVLNRL